MNIPFTDFKLSIVVRVYDIFCDNHFIEVPDTEKI